jgi:hypothetical protein
VLTCTQELQQKYPDGGQRDPDGFRAAFTACAQIGAGR